MASRQNFIPMPKIVNYQGNKHTINNKQNKSMEEKIDLLRDELEFNCNEPVYINNLKPNNVLIKMAKDTIAKTRGGILLSATGSDKPNKLNVGRIIAKGQDVSPCWKKGDLVAFSQYGGIPMPLTLYVGDSSEYILTDETSLFFSFNQQLPEDLKPENY